MAGLYFPFNWIDVAIAVALIVAASLGFIQGLLRILFACAATYIAFILASQYFHVFGVVLAGFFPSASDVALNAVGFAVVFILAQIGVNGLGFGAYRATRIGRIGILDQLGGSIIGLGLGFLLVSIAVIILNFSVKTPWHSLEETKRVITETAAGSALMPMFLAAVPHIAQTVAPWLPTGLPGIFYL